MMMASSPSVVGPVAVGPWEEEVIVELLFDLLHAHQDHNQVAVSNRLVSSTTVQLVDMLLAATRHDYVG